MNTDEYNSLYENNNLDDIILNFLVDLDMFSRLPPNVSVHLDRNNHFIITAQNISYIWGAQTIANALKSHTITKLIFDLDNFFNQIIKILANELEIINITHDHNIKLQSIKRILIICREFKLAYIGLPDTNKSGLCGLIETYKNDSRAWELANTINSAKKSFDYFGKMTNKIYAELKNNIQYDDDCLESNFTDDDWENAMKNISSLKKEYTGLYKYYLGYSTALTLTRLQYDDTQINRWDEIIRFDNNVSIYLGGLPVISNISNYFGRNDLIDLQKLNIGAVLSIAEIFENVSLGYIYSPVTPTNWKNVNIKHYQIPTPDYCSVHIETIYKGVEFIQWNIKNNRSVYVHCKSGKSRSFLIVVSYLIKYLRYNIDEALNFVKSKRIQAGFGPTSKKLDILKMFANIVGQN